VVRLAEEEDLDLGLGLGGSNSPGGYRGMELEEGAGSKVAVVAAGWCMDCIGPAGAVVVAVVAVVEAMAVRAGVGIPGEWIGEGRFEGPGTAEVGTGRGTGSMAVDGKGQGFVGTGVVREAVPEVVPEGVPEGVVPEGGLELPVSNSIQRLNLDYSHSGFHVVDRKLSLAWVPGTPLSLVPEDI